MSAGTRGGSAASRCARSAAGPREPVGEPHFGRYEELAEVLVPALLPHSGPALRLLQPLRGSAAGVRDRAPVRRAWLPTPARLVASAQVAPRSCPHGRFLDCTDELVAELELLAVLRGGQPHPALIELALEVLQLGLEVNRVYRRPLPATVIPSGITVVHWSDDVEVTEPELHGWQSYSTATRFAVLDRGTTSSWPRRTR
ncbi:hypothetical protein I6A60_13765 [Frankia sp. AgB1.9]|uniref:hypothetical protein n=1 Tax=unclassified Frankia TaxID=2632575 RepID=UPI001931AB05|nr:MULTISPECIES: hypothetical protein [unclassified Frankia]MBL7548937.1 hypothetical protein [Frankia sp. AgB1.9]